MIFDDENDPKTKKARPRVLDNMSVADLKEYLHQLRDEITRVETDIQKKEKHKASVDALFGSKS